MINDYIIWHDYLYMQYEYTLKPGLPESKIVGGNGRKLLGFLS